ncbi:MAG: MFS transporter [Actinomycetota bacterium]|nr:MFS transporter [Actinomycetota bacterium]
MARQRRFGRVVSEEERRTDELLLDVPRPHPEAGRPPRLLAIRPFLWLVVAELLANVGLWSFFVASEGEAAFGFGATPAQFGLLISSYSIVFIAASPAFGILADRWSSRALLILANAASIGVLFLALNASSLGWLYGATALFGLTQAVVWPARGALVPLLVDKDRLVQANGMMAVAWQIPLVVGPAVAGLLVRTWGADAPYILAMAATALAIPFVWAIPDRRRERGEPEHFLADLAGGFREGWGTPILRALIIRAMLAYLLLGLAITLEALYVREVLDRGRDFLGLLWASTGAGAVLGSLVLSRLREGAGREHVLIAGGLTGGGLGYVLYVVTSIPAVSAVGAFLFGAGFTFLSSPAQALIQRVARQPGRVTAVYAMLSEGGPLVTAMLVAVAGGVVAVHAWLIAAALLFTLIGVASIPGSRRRGAG